MIFLAHRGASELAPENTICSFRKANDIFTEVESLRQHRLHQGLHFDVRASGKDAHGQRQAIVFHDERIGRTSEPTDTTPSLPLYASRYPKVNRLPWSFLETLDAGAWKGPQHRGQRIPRLAEVLPLIKTGTFYALEVKTRQSLLFSNGIENMVLDFLEHFPLRDQGMVASLDPFFLSRFRSLCFRKQLPFYPIGYVSWAHKRRSRNFWLKHLRPDYLILQIHREMGREIDKAHDMNCKVFLWTLNTVDDIRAAIDSQADGVISNRPEMLLDIPEHLLYHFASDHDPSQPMIKPTVTEDLSYRI